MPTALDDTPRHDPGGRSRVAAPEDGDGVRFFDAAHDAFRRAAARVGIRDHDLVLGEHRIRLRFAGAALEPRLLPALAHVRVAPAGNPAMTVALFDTASTGAPMAPPPWGRDEYGPKGEIAGFNDDRIRTVFVPGVDILNVYDAARGAGVYWVASPSIVPWWESSFPLRTMIHWWAVPTALQPVHAGSVGLHGRGVLVAGNSGAGKSTTTLACLEAGFGYAGDDYVIVDVESLTVYSLYGTAKLEPGNLDRFPALAPAVANGERLGTEKAMVFLHDTRPESLVQSLDLCAVVLPRVTGRRESHIEPTSAAAALRVLAPTTSFHLPGYGREVMSKLTKLVRALPCYRLDAGTDLDQLAAAMATAITP
jgi:hypothetical protein